MTRQEFLDIFNGEINSYTDDGKDHIQAVADPIDDDCVFLDVMIDKDMFVALSDVSMKNMTPYMAEKIAEMAHSAWSLKKIGFMEGKIAGISAMRF